MLEDTISSTPSSESNNSTTQEFQTNKEIEIKVANKPKSNIELTKIGLARAINAPGVTRFEPTVIPTREVNISSTNITQNINIPRNITPNSSKLDKINSQLQGIIKDKISEKEEIRRQITSRQDSSMSIGGFFQPNFLENKEPSTNGKKINHLMEDLKNKEMELSSLTNNLKIAQAIEQAEHAELSRRAEEQARVAAENQMSMAIEQANSAQEQLKIAMSQAKEAEAAQQEEEKLRLLTQAKIDEYIEIAKNAELAMQTEAKIREAAEEKAQQSLNQTIQTELARQQLEEENKSLSMKLQSALDELRRIELTKQAEEAARREIDKKYIELEQMFIRVDEERKTAIDFKDQSLESVQHLENKIKNIIADKEALEDKMRELISQSDKLKNIIQTEKKLRILTEQKAKDALIKAQKAEKARLEEVMHRKKVDERAKKAIAHASKTVMHFLNAPLDEDLESHFKKMSSNGLDDLD